MQWVEGPTLARAIAERGAFPHLRVVTLAGKLASAVEALHGAGVLHRDIKPQNILLSEDHEPHLTDFGLVRLLGRTGMTRDGIFVGTPDYASPEQARTLPLDERSDIYSLGLVIFEMAVGKRPFKGGSSREILEMHQNSRPPVAGGASPVDPGGSVQPDSPLLGKGSRGTIPKCGRPAGGPGASVVPGVDEDMKNSITGGVVILLAGLFFGGSLVFAQTDSEVIQVASSSISPLPEPEAWPWAELLSGLADDATAAFSNPAGLTQFVKMEVSLEGRQTDFTHEFNDRGHAFEDPTGIGVDTVAGLQTATTSSPVLGASFFSFVYPHKRWAIAGYRHELANFETEIQTQGAFIFRSDINFTTRLFPAIGDLDLEIVAHGVSGAFSISDQFSVGLGVAFYEFEIDSLIRRFSVPFPNPSFPDTTPGGAFGPPDYSDSNLAGFEEQIGNDEETAFNVGFLWAIGEFWSLGGTYRQGPEFGFTNVATNSVGDSLERSARFSVPDVLGLGVAFGPTDALKVSFEYDRVEYSDLTEDPTVVLEPGCGYALSVDDADEFHLGFEYLFHSKKYTTAVRLGGWYDPDHTVAFRGNINSVCEQVASVRFPGGEDSLHYAAGLGLVLGKGFKIDAAVDLSDRVDTFSISAVVNF